MSQPISSQSSCCIWSTKSQIAASGVAMAAVAALISGIVLAVLQNPGALSTSLMVTGGSVALIDILYIVLSCRNQQKKESKPGQFQPQSIGYLEQAAAGIAAVKRDKEALKTTVDKVLSNWEGAKKHKTHWTLDQLAHDLGVSAFLLKQVLTQAKITPPRNGQFSKQELNQGFAQIRREFDL